MAQRVPHILYVASILPKRSETFVYREVLALRDAGVKVSVASLHMPERELGDPEVDALADEAVVVYGEGVRGKLAVYADAAKRAWIRPVRGLGEVPAGYWMKHVFQSEAGYALAHRVAGRGVTHVHAHFAHTPASVAMACAAALGVPFSFTGHAADLFRDGHALKTKLTRAAFVSCISQWHRGWYRETAPGLALPDAKLPVVRCGVDVRRFVPGGGLPDGATGGASGGAMRVLAVGRLVAKKGFDILLRTVAEMPAGCVTVRLMGDGPEEAALRTLRDELGLGDVVEMTGKASHQEVHAAMQPGVADAFVLPCRVDPAGGDKDGIPVVLMEAMASGLPVLSGDLPAIRELVEPGVTGLLSKPGDADELKVRLLELRDPAVRTRLARAGRERVEDEFAMGPNIQRLLAAFKAAAATALSSGGPGVQGDAA